MVITHWRLAEDPPLPTTLLTNPVIGYVNGESIPADELVEVEYMSISTDGVSSLDVFYSGSRQLLQQFIGNSFD